MTIMELQDAIREARDTINKKHKALTKKIQNRFRGIKPEIFHTSRHLKVFVHNERDKEQLCVLTVNHEGVKHTDQISEDFADTIKNDFLEAYGGFEEPVEHTITVTTWEHADG